VPYYIGRP